MAEVIDLHSIPNAKRLEIKAIVERDVDVEKDNLPDKAIEIMLSYIYGPLGNNEHYRFKDIYLGIVKEVEKEVLEAKELEELP